jgi:hypothetical protein
MVATSSTNERIHPGWVLYKKMLSEWRKLKMRLKRSKSKLSKRSRVFVEPTLDITEDGQSNIISIVMAEGYVVTKSIKDLQFQLWKSIQLWSTVSAKGLKIGVVLIIEIDSINFVIRLQ